jgi:hypothetical protein
MKVSDYIRQFRTIADDKSAPYLWEDDEIALWAHQGYYELAKLAKCIRDKTTTAVCSITIPANSPPASYTLHSKIIEIYSVKHSAKYTPMDKKNEAELDATISNWWSRTSTIPDYYLQDTDLTKIVLVPAPTAGGTLTLSVARLPLIDLYPYVAEGTDNEPSEIRADWQPYILEYILHKAYMKDDVETYNEKKSAAAWARFLDKVDQVKRDVIRITRAERSFGMHWGTI